MKIGQRVNAYLTSRTYCAGVVEFIEPERIGVRLVNGNFRWCAPSNLVEDESDKDAAQRCPFCRVIPPCSLNHA